MSGPGHNGGPSLEPGVGWRRHCWRTARSALLPTLPIEVVRTRVRRAAELGLDYKTYAGVRATTGRDLVAFLFSTNALRLLRDSDRMRREEARRLSRIAGADRLLAVQPPLSPDAAREALRDQGVAIQDALHAPGLSASWSETGQRLRGFLAGCGYPADGVLVIGETVLERDWVAAARLAGFVSADAYFARTVASQTP
ncbi:hypothetical protein OEW28_11050 [Defluviimonas sp. WL0002]|uniref:Uncharacterized protein n=1 Tax=Albidovulum marisflavi TaxID=2984159 RepID=A0ABT2ZDG6_9RHOB|nr:hypothetical protein [Defluviimonas sp. WL0002]MCV2869164.1 hypothetical protein [Defluviimonas sp. WL0002]